MARTTKAQRIEQIVYFLKGCADNGITATEDHLLKAFPTLSWATLQAGIDEYNRLNS